MPRLILPRPIEIPIGPSIAYVPLTQGQFALIDREDAEPASHDSWRANWSPKTLSFYAITTRQITPGPHGRKIFKLHRVLMGIADPEIQIDHANRCTLDCRRSANLRIATHAQNQFNRIKHRDNTSGYKGVNWNCRSKKWTARISANRHRVFLGAFDSPEDGFVAYCKAAEEFHGKFARTV
jgi:hypothetical protein